jgi:peroxiredoxin
MALGFICAMTGCHLPAAKIGDPAKPSTAEIGQPTPQFNLPSLVGASRVTSSDLMGHVAVLDFWAVWCEHCRESLLASQTLQQRHPDVVVLGIAVDDNQSGMRRVAKELNIGFPMGRDPSGATTAVYRVSALPTTYVLDRKSIIRYQHVGTIEHAAIETEVEDLLRP